MLCTGKEACCTWYNVQCYVQERLPAVPGIKYSVYIYRKGCLVYWYSVQCLYVQERLPALPGIKYSVYIYSKGCLLYLVFCTVLCIGKIACCTWYYIQSICTGKVACCTWYSVKCIYLQERLPAVPGILYSVYMYRKGCLLYLVFCTMYMYRKGCLLYLVFCTMSICTGKVACCTWYSVDVFWQAWVLWPACSTGN